MSRELIIKAEAIMKNASDAYIAGIDENGFPRVSTISNIRTYGVKTVWFATGLSSGKVKCFIHNNKAGICYHEDGNNITLSGTIEILTDLEVKKQLWQDWFINHFSGGVDDPNYCILKFTAGHAVFWIDNRCEETEL